MASLTVTPVAPGEYVVEHDGGQDRVFAARRGAVTWIFWNGHVYRVEDDTASAAASHRSGTVDALTAPMPARVVRLLVSSGDQVKKGQTVVLLEAMKMELPVRAPADQVVGAIRCREGELVQADQVLVELQ